MRPLSLLRKTISSGPRARCGADCGAGVLVHEVSPRDGLQNEPQIVGVDAKLRLLEAAAACAPYSIEVTSFVRADRVPQLADADELCARLVDAPWAVAARHAGVRFAGLVPNRRGLERFAACADAGALDTVSVITSATDGHSRANVGMGVAKAVEVSAAVVRQAKGAGFAVRGYVSMAWQCPIDGAADPGQVMDIVAAYAEAGADVIVLADTIGRAVPDAVEALCLRAQAQLRATGGAGGGAPPELGLHMHDTTGRAAENCAVGLRLGWRHLDSAIAGCGGCPFAPGAAGNLDTEALLGLCEAEGYEHGMRAERVRGAAALLHAELARAPDAVSQATAPG
eukprot:g3365.t1